MSAPVLCQVRRSEDDARCVLNADHVEDANVLAHKHAYVHALDSRLRLLDDLANTFKRNEVWAAYHHVRAVAHDLGFHLSTCVQGLRAIPNERPE